MSESTEKENKFWYKIESLIKDKESIILLTIILLAFIYMPFKILSLGWTPPDDALRHVGFSMLDTKWSNILIIDEKFDTDHNAGWHQVLRFLRKHLQFEKGDLMMFSVAALFILVNVCGIISVPSPICWCVALLMVLQFDGDIWSRLILGRPYMVSCAATLIILRLWGIRPLEEEKIPLLQKSWFRYAVTIFALTMTVWIHGTWYIMLIIPISFFIAGKMKEALQLTGCVLISTVIGALLTGNFLHFLYYHFVATFTIYSEDTYNWLLVTENACGCQTVYWIVFAAILVFLCKYKNNKPLKDLAYDPVFMLVLLCWLGSILVRRFWIDWGRTALLVWISYRVGELISSSESLKNPRIRYCLALFMVAATVFSVTNDSSGRYTKAAFEQAIDFYSDSVREKMAGWEPEPGGIIYSDDMHAFYDHFYEYPDKPWKYILGFESGIMRPEDKKILRNIGYNGGVPDEYLPWIERMTEKDRIILRSVPGNFPQLEWIRGNKCWWIGRLKREDEKENSQAKEN